MLLEYYIISKDTTKKKKKHINTKSSKDRIMRNRLCQLYGNSVVTEPKQLRNSPSPS